MKRRIKTLIRNCKFIYKILKFGLPDYDHHYLYQVEKAKLEQMLDHHQNLDLGEGIEFGNTQSNIRDLKICIKLLDLIILDDDVDLVPVKSKRYYDIVCNKTVNVQNAGRFHRPWKEYLNEEDIEPSLKESIKGSLYREKCIRLYNLIRAYRAQNWWD